MFEFILAKCMPIYLSKNLEDSSHIEYFPDKCVQRFSNSIPSYNHKRKLIFFHQISNYCKQSKCFNYLTSISMVLSRHPRPLHHQENIAWTFPQAHNLTLEMHHYYFLQILHPRFSHLWCIHKHLFFSPTHYHHRIYMELPILDISFFLKAVEIKI